MKKLFTLLLFLTSSSILFAQSYNLLPAQVPSQTNAPGVTPLYTESPNVVTRAACAPDTVLYTRAKMADTTGYFVTLDPATADAVAQYFDAPQDIEVGGATVHLIKGSNIPNPSIQVSVEMYLANADSIPTGGVLASDTITVDWFTPFSLTSSKRVALWTPVTVNQPYVIVMRNLSSESMVLVGSDYINALDGAGEWLPSMRFGNTWVRSYNVNVGGLPYDADALVYPYVQYSINPGFSTDPECLLQPGLVDFTNSGAPVVDSRMYNRHVFNGSFLAQTWNFGDGSPTVNLFNPSYNYINNAPFIATLTTELLGWNNQVCIEGSSKIIQAKPVQRFKATSENLETSFTNTSLGSFSNVSWDFGDGSTSLVGNPVHEYANPGTYKVCMSMSSTCGITTVCDNVPVARELTLNCGKDTLLYTYARRSSNLSFPIDTNAQVKKLGQLYRTPQTIIIHGFMLHAWHDGPNDSLVPLACKIYQAAPNNLPLPGPAIDSTIVYIDTIDIQPTTSGTRKAAIFNNPITLNKNEHYIVTVEAMSNLPVNIMTSNWFNMDGDGDNFSVAHQNNLWVQGSFFIPDITQPTINFDADVLLNPIVEYNYDASFTFSPECVTPPQTVAFTNNSSEISSHEMYNQIAFNGSVTDAYTWDFGDSSFIQNAVSPSHFYDDIGPFNPILSIENQGWTVSCVDTQTLNIPVPPTALFNYDVNTSAVTFTDSSFNAIEWRWEFSDNTISTLQNPVHYFQSTGDFEVCLLVSNVCGSDTICDTINISVIGIEDPAEQLQSLEVYPNPAKDQLFLSLDLGQQFDVSIELRDITGRIVRNINRQNATQLNETISLNDLADGAYFVRVKTNAGVVVKRVIVSSE